MKADASPAHYSPFRPAYGHNHKCEGCERIYVCRKNQHYNEPYRCEECGPSKQEIARIERQQKGLTRRRARKSSGST